MFKKYQQPYEQLAEIMKRISEMYMVSYSGGNASLVDDDGNVWMTPKGLPKCWLTPELMAKYSPDGKQLSKYRGSTEAIINFEIHKVRPDIKGLVHSHSAAVLSYMLARKEPNVKILAGVADVVGKVVYTPFQVCGSEELKAFVAKAFADGNDVVFMENHGLFVGGSDIYDAFAKMEMIEVAAQTEMWSNAVSKGKQISYLTDEQIEAYHKVKAAVKYETYKPASYPVEEIPLRNKLMDMAARAYDERLISIMHGCLSVRAGENVMLITPANCDFTNIREDEIVRVENGKVEAGKVLPIGADICLQIFKDHPDCKSVMVSCPCYGMTFGVTDTPIDCYADFEVCMYVHEVGIVPFGSTAKEISEKIRFQVPVVIVRNDCMVSAAFESYDHIKAVAQTQLVNNVGKVAGNIGFSGFTMYHPDTDELDTVYHQFTGK